jgi:hypothetical protein
MYVSIHGCSTADECGLMPLSVVGCVRDWSRVYAMKDMFFHAAQRGTMAANPFVGMLQVHCKLLNGEGEAAAAPQFKARIGGEGCRDGLAVRRLEGSRLVDRSPRCGNHPMACP